MGVALAAVFVAEADVDLAIAVAEEDAVLVLVAAVVDEAEVVAVEEVAVAVRRPNGCQRRNLVVLSRKAVSLRLRTYFCILFASKSLRLLITILVRMAQM